MGDSVYVECVERLRGLIDNLLDVTALETGKLKLDSRRLDFAEVFGRALAGRRAAFGRAGVELAVEVPDAVLEGQGDPERLGQALEHLLDNAIKFTPEGTITLFCKAEAHPEHPDALLLQMELKDTGHGIEPEALKRVLEPFEQASAGRRAGGAGLGLPISRRQIEAMDGEMRIESQPGAGTTCTTSG